MPVVAVKLPEKLFRQIARLVADGAFETPGQFLETAAFNQLALEAGAPPETLGRDAPHAVARAGAHAREETPAANRTKSVPRAPERAGSVVLRTSVRERVPNEYARADDRKESFGDLDGALHRLSLAQLIDKALPEAAPAKPRPGDERLWVQFNRVFGLKVACRWIACASAGAQTWPEVSVCTDAMASDVAELGSALERADAMAGRKRDELLATGLPRRRNMASLDRFVSQTIARITRAGTVYPGAVLQYSLAVLDGRRIALTDRGSFFAQMPNPILDAVLFAATTTLSRDEQKFLL